VSTLNLDPGDVLCLYSDGLIEARDESGDLFDVERLEKALESAARHEGKLDSIADGVLQTVAEHARRREDDWTLLLIRRAA
jgi:serine phosphatase RsbU (regulator of sigma subunit)